MKDFLRVVNSCANYGERRDDVTRVQCNEHADSCELDGAPCNEGEGIDDCLPRVGDSRTETGRRSLPDEDSFQPCGGIAPKTIQVGPAGNFTMDDYEVAIIDLLNDLYKKTNGNAFEDLRMVENYIIDHAFYSTKGVGRARVKSISPYGIPGRRTKLLSAEDSIDNIVQMNIYCNIFTISNMHYSNQEKGS